MDYDKPRNSPEPGYFVTKLLFLPKSRLGKLVAQIQKDITERITLHEKTQGVLYTRLGNLKESLFRLRYRTLETGATGTEKNLLFGILETEHRLLQSELEFQKSLSILERELLQAQAELDSAKIRLSFITKDTPDKEND